MNRLQLATLLSWSGAHGLQGRKRLQKVVFFLQQAGCPLGCQYTLHHFGPYSRDVADICDEMVAAHLIDESGGSQNGSMQYTYKLKPSTGQLLANSPDDEMKRYQPLGESLMNENIWTLELGSTILYFYRQLQDWEEAMRKACGFKKVSVDENRSVNALDFAQRMSAQPAVN